MHDTDEQEEVWKLFNMVAEQMSLNAALWTGLEV